jgi:hypothetical protein
VSASWATPRRALDLGGGLDLGYVRGFHAAEEGGFRWTRDVAEVRLRLPAEPATHLVLRLASGRPAGAPAAQVTVLVNGVSVGVVRPSAAWQTFDLALPDGADRGGDLVVTLRSNTFRPRDLDRTSPDGRSLGVMVDEIGLVAR